MTIENTNDKIKNNKAVRAYTIDCENIERLKKLRETQGISSSWVVNKAIADFIKREYGLD